MTPDRFHLALNFVLRWEGGFVNHPADPGGATNAGITQRTYDAYHTKMNLPWKSVQLITPPEIEAIYQLNYWAAGRCALLPEPVDMVHFDACVNHGPGLAAKLLQKVVQVPADGRIGEVTVAAVQARNSEQVATEYIAERRRFYGALAAKNPSQLVFLRGWLKRMDSLEREIQSPPK